MEFNENGVKVGENICKNDLLSKYFFKKSWELLKQNITTTSQERIPYTCTLV